MKPQPYPWKLATAAVTLILFVTACSSTATPPPDTVPMVETAPATPTTPPTEPPAAPTVTTEPVSETATTLPEDEPVAATATSAPVKPQKLYNGLPQGVTEEGFPTLGQPDAPVTVIDYGDFL